MKQMNQRLPVERVDIAGLSAAWIRPDGADSKKVHIHLHGGGYVTGFVDSHLMMCVPLAKSSR